MGGTCNTHWEDDACKTCSEKIRRGRRLGICSRRLEDNIKVDLKGEGVDVFHLARSRVRCSDCGDHDK